MGYCNAGKSEGQMPQNLSLYLKRPSGYRIAVPQPRGDDKHNWRHRYARQAIMAACAVSSNIKTSKIRAAARNEAAKPVARTPFVVVIAQENMLRKRI